jgi:sterol desaturase/sphingolipid hydroxylase (fatty acid hydroxylase superfamily)
MRSAPSLIGLSVSLIAVAIIFGTMERLAPAVRGVSIWRKRRGIDFLYWFFTPIVTRTISTAAVVVTAIAVSRMSSGVAMKEAVARQPRLLQVAELLILTDLVGYWTHRAFHHQPLWPIHAVHHSSTELDWLAAARVHPLNEILTRAVQVIPFLLLGFKGVIIAGLVPLLTLYATFLHANVTWDFGPLRCLIASPRFHRWHHTSEDEGLNRNFAGLFPWMDLLFGTFYLPSGRQPSKFGVSGQNVPSTFVGQMLYPLRRKLPE